VRRPAPRGAILAGLTALALAAVTALSACGTVQQAGTWAGATTSPAAHGKPGSSASASASATPSAAPTMTPAYNIQPLLDPTQKYVGVEMPGAPDSMTPVKQFASWVGKAPNLVGNYVAWGTAFDAQAAQNAWNYGAMYFMVWEPWSTSCDQIAAGASDAYITDMATAIRTLNVPVALSFGHEMNGTWYPWGTQQTTAAQFVAAWQHIHDLFVRAGATNVIWIWDPNNIYPVPNVQLEPYYPGDAYVDWAGVTGYFDQGGPDTYSELLGPTITEIQKFTKKPILLAETSVEPGSDEISSVDNLFNSVEDNSDIIGFVWYDYDKGGDWRLENRSSVKTAFADHVANSIFGFNVTQPG
jgi:hypothetical protein